MKVFGLTGGVGMGKSAAEQWLRQHGTPVVDSDLLARQIVEPGSPVLLEIQRAFGSRFIDTNGRLKREELAATVFSNPSARQTLEHITHPRIRELWLKQLAEWDAEGRPTGVLAIPLLFETGAEAALDATVCVACSPATQLQRLLARGWSAHEIALRNAAQWPIEQKMAKAGFVVWNDGSLDVLAAQLSRIFC